jgi:Fe-S cluster assembly ATP-binding protein
VDGRVVRSGGPELAHELEQRGYDWIVQEVLSQKEA